MVKKIKKIIIRWAVTYCKSWGVEYETRLPPEFLITKHAEEGIKQRFNVSENKIKKVIIKSWYNKEKINNRVLCKLLRNRKYGRTSYKIFNGFIFVFKCVFVSKLGINQKVLLTVYDPKVVNYNNEEEG